MAYTQADIDALKASIKQGVLRVRKGDREIEYRSLAEMREQLAVMENEVNGSSATPRFSLATHSRG